MNYCIAKHPGCSGAKPDELNKLALTAITKSIKSSFLDANIIHEKERYDGFYYVCTNLAKIGIDEIIWLSAKSWEIEGAKNISIHAQTIRMLCFFIIRNV